MLDREDNKKLQVRPIPLWAILVCGLIVTAIGVYLKITNGTAEGNVRKGTPVAINGLGIIVVGIIVCTIPIYYLIKNSSNETES